MGKEPLDLVAAAAAAACKPVAVSKDGFNRNCALPFGLTTEHLYAAMRDFTDFLEFLNTQLHSRDLPRLETLMMPANFSSTVGEFMHTSIAKHCKTLVKNRYHNGHPDLIPAGQHPNDSVQHCEQGIEIKASRYLRGWQGHNPENCWLMVFVFESGRPSDGAKDVDPIPFQFVMVSGAQLTKDDWLFSGRSETSRRTITASVTRSGYDKMMQNWIYRVPRAFELL